MSEFENTIRELNKRFGKHTLISGNDMTALEVKRVSTGSLSLDVETGGGLPFGRLVELYGYESSGKSYIAAKTVANAQAMGKKAVWIDVEGTFDPVWASLIGIDVGKLMLTRPDKGEIACDILDAVIRSGDCGIVVLDSVAALVPNQDLETAMEDCEQIGIRAKLINRIVRKLTSALNIRVGEESIPNECLVIFINQIRQKVGVMYGNPDTTPGGLGLKFAASLRIELRKKWLKDPANEDHIIGQTVTFNTVKNKTYPPYRHGEFDFYIDGDTKGQIDLPREVMVYGVIAGLINQKDKTYTIGKESFVGKEKVVAYLKENPKLVQELRVKILNHFFGRK